MARNQKAHDMAREIADRLAQRQSALAVTESIDSDGHPVLRVGSASAGDPGALIRIEPADFPLAVDVLGLESTIFVPLRILVGFEDNGTGMDVNDLDTYAVILGELFNRGVQVDVYASANGDNPDAADLGDATKLKYSWKPDPVYGLIAGQ